MFWLYYILLFLLILLLIPIPIKLNFIYKKLTFNIYIYNFKLNLDKIMCFIIKKKKKTPISEKLEEETLDLKDIFSLLNYIDNIKYKPTLRFRFYCNFGLIDASKTAITYGYISTVSPVLYKFLTIPFKIKRYDYDIKPDFDKTFLETNINSIIFVNLIKIIYMFILIKNKLKHLEEMKKEK